MIYFNIVPSDFNVFQLKFCRHAQPISSFVDFITPIFCQEHRLLFLLLEFKTLHSSFKNVNITFIHNFRLEVSGGVSSVVG
jgi:hypothetical protein